MLKPTIACGLLLLGAACSRPPSETAAPPTPAASLAPSPPAAPVDACALLTSEDAASVLGEAITETKPSQEMGDGLTISQCSFSLASGADVLTLRVVEAGGKGAPRSPRQVWRETFARDLEAAREKRKGGVEAVAGVGDEAFWMGGPKVGGLYVLKGDRYIRIGLGGEPNQPTKIEKAKGIAAAVLERLK